MAFDLGLYLFHHSFGAYYARYHAASTVDLSKPMRDDETYEPRFFALKGRIGRLPYLIYSITASVALTTAGFLVVKVLGAISPALAAENFIFYLPATAFLLVITILRLHDLNQGGWWGLLRIVPVAGVRCRKRGRQSLRSATF